MFSEGCLGPQLRQHRSESSAWSSTCEGLVAVAGGSRDRSQAGVSSGACPPVPVFWAVFSPAPDGIFPLSGGCWALCGFLSARELGRGTGSFQIPVLDCPLSRV